MKKILLYGLMGLTLQMLSSCSEEQSVRISSGEKDNEQILKQAENIDKASYAGLEDVFLDTKNLHINKDNKITLFIFAKNNCIYCDKLKDDILSSDALKNMLKDNFMPYYINTSYTKKHILYKHKGDSQDVQNLNTRNLMESYVKSPMRPTPTLVFLDYSGNNIYELPGYLPKDSMLEILEYFSSGVWVGKSEKQIATEISDTIIN